MPSGAKRRKAAKKKKEQQTHNNNNSDNSSSSINNRNDDPKSQDERDSDGGEVGSPASQDHHSQEHPLNEENEESEKGDHLSFQSEYKLVEGVTGHGQESHKAVIEDEHVVEIETQLNSELDIESKDVSVEHVESVKESHDGDDKSSRSSSSEGEFHTNDNKWNEEDHNSASDPASFKNVEKVFPEERDSGIEKPIGEVNGSSVVETYSTNDLAEPQEPMSEVAKCVMGGAEVKNVEILDVIESGLQVNEDKLLPKSIDTIGGSVQEKYADKAVPVLDENVGVSTAAVTSSVNGNKGEISGSHSAEKTICAEKSKDFETSRGTVIANEGKVVTPSGAHTSEANNGAVKAREYKSSEYTENQPLVPPPPQVTQRTSWLSCCGLFDVFSGSNR